MANKKSETSDAPQESPKQTYKVLAHLSEGGVHYSPGDLIETSPERAIDLGVLIGKAE